MNYNCIGIDVGKDTAMVATPDGRTYPLTLAGRWWEWFEEHPPQIVALEPTGVQYSSPIVAALLRLPTPPTIYMVNHHVTGLVRELTTAEEKSDETDARALAAIAEHVSQGRPIRGVYEHNPQRFSGAWALRLLVLEHARISKEQVRTKNRLNGTLYRLWPALARHINMWRKCADLELLTPREIVAITEPHELTRGHNGRWLRQLQAEIPPDIEPTPAPLRRQLWRMARELDILEAQELAVLGEIKDAVYAPEFAVVTAAWMTVPTLGVLAAAALHAATWGMAHEMTTDQFKAAVGWMPRRARSGRANRKSRSRRGYRPGLKQVFLLTLRLLNPTITDDNSIRQYFETLKARNANHPATAARRKLTGQLAGIAQTLRPWKG